MGVDPANEEQVQKMLDMLGPDAVDNAIRQAIRFCWMSIPFEKRNIDQLEAEMRRLTDRALAGMREDMAAFERKQK